MAVYKNFDEALKDIQLKINESLKNEVGQAVKETMSSEIDNTVYSVYKPLEYERRHMNGGLSDMDNMEVELVKNGTITVTNNTPVNEDYSLHYSDNSLTEMIITGTEYDYTGDGTGAYLEPRDFIEETKKDLVKTNYHVEALKNGLKKRGLIVK